MGEQQYRAQIAEFARLGRPELVRMTGQVRRGDSRRLIFIFAEMLCETLARCFGNVFSFSMNDKVVHCGFRRWHAIFLPSLSAYVK